MSCMLQTIPQLQVGRLRTGANCTQSAGGAGFDPQRHSGAQRNGGHGDTKASETQRVMSWQLTEGSEE